MHPGSSQKTGRNTCAVHSLLCPVSFSLSGTSGAVLRVMGSIPQQGPQEMHGEWTDLGQRFPTAKVHPYLESAPRPQALVKNLLDNHVSLYRGFLLWAHGKFWSEEKTYFLRLHRMSMFFTSGQGLVLGLAAWKRFLALDTETRTFCNIKLNPKENRSFYSSRLHMEFSGECAFEGRED